LAKENVVLLLGPGLQRIIHHKSLVAGCMSGWRSSQIKIQARSEGTEPPRTVLGKSWAANARNTGR